MSHAVAGVAGGAVHALFAGGRGLDHPPAVEPHPPALLAVEVLRPELRHPHDDAALRPGVAPPHPVPGAAPALAPVAYGLGVRELTFHAGVRPPSPAAYGLGVRDDAFHAGVRESAYGFGVREEAFHAGVRESPAYGLGVRLALYGVRPPLAAPPPNPAPPGGYDENTVSPGRASAPFVQRFELAVWPMQLLSQVNSPRNGRRLTIAGTIFPYPPDNLIPRPQLYSRNWAIGIFDCADIPFVRAFDHCDGRADVAIPRTSTPCYQSRPYHPLVRPELGSFWTNLHRF